MTARARLTLRGYASVGYYRLRRLAVPPAPDDIRCFMGAPIGPEVHCPRAVHGDSPWCLHHTPACAVSDGMNTEPRKDQQ